MKVLVKDPAEILDMTKEQLVVMYQLGHDLMEELTPQQKAIRDVLGDKIKGNGEVIANHAITKAKRLNWKVDLEKAKELGAVKQVVDTTVLKELHSKGIDIPHEVIDYLIIKEIKK